jgi:hypothetical protein
MGVNPQVIENAIRKECDSLIDRELFTTTTYTIKESVSRTGFSEDDCNEMCDLLIGMLYGYCEQYGDSNQGLKCTGVEFAFIIPTMCANGSYSHWSKWSGHIDKIAIDGNGSTWLVEHKTSGKPLQTWVDQNQYNPQAITYMYGVRSCTGKVPAGVIYDLARKRLPPSLDKYKTVKVKGGGNRLSYRLPAGATYEGAIEVITRDSLIVDQRTEDLLDNLQTKEQDLFRREWTRFHEGEIDRAGHELHAAATALRRASESLGPLPEALQSDSEGERLDAAVSVLSVLANSHPRNASGCYRYGSKCEYSELCRYLSRESTYGFRVLGKDEECR